MFQFLGGTLKTIPCTHSLRICSYVSIPRRYPKNQVLIISFQFKLLFQFLGGTLKTFFQIFFCLFFSLFQFLGGTLKTATLVFPGTGIDAFQFLGGTLKTMVILIHGLKRIDVSIPRRYPKNYLAFSAHLTQSQEFQFLGGTLKTFDARVGAVMFD